jgi:hypothetical protein
MTSRAFDPLLKDSSSFRDSSGFIFEYEGEIYRNVDFSAKDDFELLKSSNLLEKLINCKSLVRHEEVALPLMHSESFTILKPERIPVITYPQEWCFSQLKDAALITLSIVKDALDHGMILKDASAFNIQFIGSRPIFIDTLSFTKYEPGKPWVAYRQFCEHFLAPLAICSRLGVQYLSLLKNSLDGVSLTIASKILPWQTWLNPACLFHIHLHAKSIQHFSEDVKKRNSKNSSVSEHNFRALIHHLEGFIKPLTLPGWNKTQWQNYDQQTHYDTASWKSKAAIVKGWVEKVRPKTLWDVGGNDGTFSRLAKDEVKTIVSMDFDPLAIEKNYAISKAEAPNNVYSLVMDLTNPTSSFGWANTERKSFKDRSAPDMIVALAVIHHITITHNVPFSLVSKYFSDLAQWLLIEFVPPDDEKILPLPNTAGKTRYTRDNFDKAFLSHYTLIDEKKIEGSQRSLLLFQRSR